MGTKNGKKSGKKKVRGKIEKGDIFEHELSRPLGPGDIAKKKDELYQAVAKRAELKETIRPVQQDIAALSKTVEKVRKEIKAKTETTMVRCQEERNFKKRKIQVRRLDTGKLVPDLEEDMTDEDRTGELFPSDKPPSSKKAKGKAGSDEELIAEAQEAEVLADELEDVPAVGLSDELPDDGDEARA